MGVDQDAAHALNTEILDKAHAAHVSRQVVDLDSSFNRSAAVISMAQVEG